MPRLMIALMALLLSTAPALANPTTVAYGSNAKQQLDIYKSATACPKDGCPVVIWVHGGGWRHGDKAARGAKAIGASWPTQGIVTVSLNYRLTPEVTHPGHIEDVAAGFAWVKKNITQYGGNSSRVFMMGHSAGAHLVALLGTNPKYVGAHGLRLTDIAGVMPIDTASFDLSQSQSRMVGGMIDKAFGTNPATLADASPLLFAQQSRGPFPPFIIATVKQRPDAVAESKALQAALPSARLIINDYPESGQLKAHGDIARDLANLTSPMTQQLLAFVKGR